jgi:plastocyanin
VARTTRLADAANSDNPATLVEATTTVVSESSNILVVSGATTNVVPSTQSQSRTAIPKVNPTALTSALDLSRPGPELSPLSTTRDGGRTASTPIREASTMFSGLAKPLPSATLKELSQMAIHEVEVGALRQLIFNLNQISADVGDVVRFTFRSFNHSLVQSSLAKPCVSNNEFHSGFRQFNAANSQLMTLSFTVNNPEPQFFFCQQTLPASHCERGMVFAINPGESMDTFLENVGTVSHWKAESASASAAFPTIVVGKDSAVSFPGTGTATGPSVTGIQLKSLSSNVAVSTGAGVSSTALPIFSRMV